MPSVVSGAIVLSRTLHCALRESDGRIKLNRSETFNTKEEWDLLLHLATLNCNYVYKERTRSDRRILPFSHDVIAGLPCALRARGTKPHTHWIWSSSFRLAVTWLTKRTHVLTAVKRKSMCNALVPGPGRGNFPLEILIKTIAETSVRQNIVERSSEIRKS